MYMPRIGHNDRRRNSVEAHAIATRSSQLDPTQSIGLFTN